MRYLAIYRPTGFEEGMDPTPEHMAEMGKLTEEMFRTGALVATEPLTVRAKGARVRYKDGAFSVAEEGERAAGYAILNAASREEAIELCRKFLKAAGEGETELRQIMEMPAPG